MENATQYETQYYENDTIDEVWVLVDGELKLITGGNDDDDSEEGQ